MAPRTTLTMYSSDRTSAPSARIWARAWSLSSTARQARASAARSPARSAGGEVSGFVIVDPFAGMAGTRRAGGSVSVANPGPAGRGFPVGAQGPWVRAVSLVQRMWTSREAKRQVPADRT